MTSSVKIHFVKSCWWCVKLLQQILVVDDIRVTSRLKWDVFRNVLYQLVRVQNSGEQL
jgi:hypothetical protein